MRRTRARTCGRTQALKALRKNVACNSTGRRLAEGEARPVLASCRADRELSIGAKVEILRDGADGVGRSGLLVVLQRIGLSGAIDLSEVVETSVSLAGCAGLYEIRNGNRRQKPDNGYDNHDFHQGKP